MVKIAYFDFNKQFSESIFQYLLSGLPKIFREKILRYHRWQDRYASLFGKYLLKDLLLSFGFEKDCLNQLKKTEYGRLYIDDQIDFNISHSGTEVVCAISDTSKVGIDIEKVLPIDINEFRPFLTTSEWQNLSTSNSKQYDFYMLWTQKESLIKADGRGLNIDLKDIKIVNNVGLIEDTHLKKSWYLNRIDKEKNSIIHLCTNKEKVDINIIKYKEDRWKSMTN